MIYGERTITRSMGNIQGRRMAKALIIREMSMEEFRAKLRKGIPALDLDVEIMALEEVEKTQDQHWILGMLRQLRVRRSDAFEGMAWLDQAEDVWHFSHDVVELGSEVTLLDGETVIRDRGRIHLWGLYAHSWGEFCQTVLNMPTEEARLRERVWDEFAVRQEMPRELLASARRTCLKRAVHFARLLREVDDTERLEDLHNRLFSVDSGEHRPDTFRELNDWITEEHQKIKTEATFRKPWVMLDYEEIERRGKLVGRVFLRMAGETQELGELRFNEPPEELEESFERGRELVRRRLARKAKDERELLEQIPLR